MSSFTAQEKEVGRAFRDDLDAKLAASFDADPPTYAVATYLAIYRHNCPARQRRSTAMVLREMYRLSPAEPGVPLGRFGYIYREGLCSGCGQTARSRIGRLVDGWSRPPLRPITPTRHHKEQR